MRYLLLAVLFAVHAAAAAQVHDKDSAAEGRMQTLRKGVELHKSGKYEAAIKVYESVLAESSDDPMALYEMAFSYMALKNYDKCAEAAQRSAKQEFPARAQAFGLLASCHDDAGRIKEALLTFEQATAVFPKDPMLNYNYAVTLIRQKSPGKARERLRTAIESAPRFPSPYRAYAMLLRDEGNRSAALFMNLRLMMLEAPSPRTAEAARDAVDLILSASRKGPDGKAQLPITLAANPEVEGKEFDTLNVGLGTLRATTLDVAPASGPGVADGFVSTAQTFLALAGEQKSSGIQQRFVWKHAADPVLGLGEQDVLKPFFYHVAALARADGAQEWLRANEPEFRKLVEVLNKAAR